MVEGDTFPVREVKIDSDGFALGTPSAWKEILLSANPNQVVVDGYQKLCSLGSVLVHYANFHPHPLQRPLDQEHAQKIADDLADTFSHRRHPCLAVAQTPPAPQAIHEESPFMEADGVTPIQVLTLWGNHRVAALGLYNAKEAWMCHVLHPCFLVINAEHIKRHIVADNLATETDLTRRPATANAAFQLALDLFHDVSRTNSRENPVIQRLCTANPNLELFKGSASRPDSKEGKWKLAFRILMREPHLLTNLRRLFRTDGGVSQLDGVELGDMLWQLATHAVGAELALLYVLRQTTETQRQLNEVWRGLCPDGFTFADLQYEVERQTYNENDGDADAANLTEIRDELSCGLHTGDWTSAFEACPVFMDEFDCGRVRDAQGNQIDVTRIPDRHMACVPSPKHNQEGWMITLLRRVRVCFRILCLLLFGPVGVTSYTDPSPRSLLQTANNFHTVQVSVVSLRLQSFLRQDARCPASGDERYRWIRQKIVSTVRRFTAAEELDRWYLPLDIWDRLKAASNSTLGEYAAPAVPDGAVNKSLYPAIAAVANRILGNRAWYSLVIEEWGLQPGEPFPWEQSVNVTEHTPEEAEQLEVERHARSEFLRVQQDMLAEKLAVESALAAKTHERGEVEQRKVVLDRAAAENLREKVAKIDKSVARAVDRGERKKVDLEADAALGSADLRDTIEDLTEQAKKLQRQLAEKQAYIDELPSKDDAESLDIDTLIKALKKRGLDVVEHVYTGEDVLDPASKQIEHTPTPSQSTEDFQEGLRKVLRDVAAVVPNPVRERMVRLASRATHGPDRALAAAIREGLQILPSLQPPTTQSTRRSKQQTPRSRPVSQEPGTPTPQAGRRSTRLSPASSEPVAGLSATTPAVFRAGSRVRRERPSPSTPRAERKRLRRRRPNSPSVTPDSSERGSGRSVSPDDGEEDQAPPAAQRRGYSDARVLVPSTSDLSAKLDEDKTLVAPPSRLPQPHSRRAQRNTLLSSSPDGSPFDTTEERGISPAHALRSSSPIPRTFHEFSDELIPTQPASQLSDNVPRGPARTDVFADPHGNVGNLFP